MNLHCYKILISVPFILISITDFAQENKASGDSRRENYGEIKPERIQSNSGGGSPSAVADPAIQAIMEEIKAQLATMGSKPLMELIEFCKKKKIVGDFVVDLTVEGKGKIVTVFMVSTPEIEMHKKNSLKDKLTQLSFDNMKIPKKERVKLRYTFKF